MANAIGGKKTTTGVVVFGMCKDDDVRPIFQNEMASAFGRKTNAHVITTDYLNDDIVTRPIIQSKMAIALRGKAATSSVVVSHDNDDDFVARPINQSEMANALRGNKTPASVLVSHEDDIVTSSIFQTEMANVLGRKPTAPMTVSKHDSENPRSIKPMAPWSSQERPSKTKAWSCLCAWLLIYPICFVPMIFTSGWPLIISSSQDMQISNVRAYTEWNGVSNMLELLKRNPIMSSLQRRVLQEENVQTVNLYYEANYNVFDFVDVIKHFEGELWKFTQSLCTPPSLIETTLYAMVGNTTTATCAKMGPGIDSFVNYFFAQNVSSFDASNGVSHVLLFDGQSQKRSKASDVVKFWINEQIGNFLPRRFSQASTATTNSRLTRTSFQLTSSNAGILASFMEKNLLDELRIRANTLSQTVQISWASPKLFDAELARAIQHDSLLALASVFIVILFLFFLLDGSLFLATFGFISLALALLTAYGVFVAIFRIRKMFQLSFLSVFVLYGLGSDAMFLFADEFDKNRGDVRKAWVAGAKATFAALSTTSTAFFANAISPIAVVKEWGLFMGLTTICAWCTISTIFFAALVVHSLQSTTERAPETKCAFCLKRHCVTAWFRHQLIDILFRFRFVLFLGTCTGALASIVSIVVFDSLRPHTNHLPVFFQPVHNLGRVIALQEEFDWVGVTNDASSPMTAFLSSSSSGPSFKRSVVCREVDGYALDPVLGLCILQSQSPTQFECPTDPKNGLTCSGKGSCVLTKCQCELGYFSIDCSDSLDAELNDGLTEKIYMQFGLLPVSASVNPSFDAFAIQERLLAFCAYWCANETTVSNSRCFRQPLRSYKYSRVAEFFPNVHALNVHKKSSLGYRRLQECGMGDFVEFVNSQHVPFPIMNRTEFDELVNSFIATIPLIETGSAMFSRNTKTRKLGLIRLQVVSSFSHLETTTASSHEYYLNWQSRIGELNREGLDSSATCVVTAQQWARTETELAAVSGFASSWGITTSIALVAVLIYSRSLLMTIFAGLTFTSIVLIVFAFCFNVLGWQFGIIEAVCFSVVLGLAVNYCAHLCYAWQSSAESGILLKAKDAAGNVGFSIASSCITTVASCSVLFAAEIVPFQKFGAIVCLSVVLSFIYALGFLTPLLIYFGNSIVNFGKWQNQLVVFVSQQKR